MNIDRRVPFGFSGEWGKVYKLYTANDKDGGIIYQQGFYVDIGQDVQFQCERDKVRETTQAVENLLDKGETKYIRTGDAWFDGAEFRCVADIGDIIEYEGDYWVVTRLEVREIFVPNPLKIYRLGITKVFDIERR